MRLVDPDEREAEYEWEIIKNKDGTTTTKKTGTKGGDSKDYITYKNDKGEITGTEEVDVISTKIEGEMNSTSRGPGYKVKMVGTKRSRC